MVTETGNLAIHDGHSTVSWKAVLAGGIASLAITLILLAFGIGVGFSVVSPWANTGVSATTFTLAAGVYLIVVAMLSSTIGGYIAGRMRSQWQTVHEHERYFRDTAHGFLVWALATVVSAAVLGGATTNLLSGASAGLAPAASSAAQASPNAVYIDNLLRKDPTAASASTTTPATAAPANSGSDMNVTRGEIARIMAPSLRKGGDCFAGGQDIPRQACVGPDWLIASRRRATRRPSDHPSQDRCRSGAQVSREIFALVGCVHARRRFGSRARRCRGRQFAKQGMVSGKITASPDRARSTH